ncbi:Hypothetical protein A7982_02990 [Minicystis rosea]|nr:Hypothetical protein A7982_02990 [Minicystis rosea]
MTLAATDPSPLPDRPEAVSVTLGSAPDARPATTRPPSTASFLYLDCGAWIGDGRHVAVQRSFAVVCGEHAVLCEFQAGRAARDPGHTGPEAQAITRLLAALAGPQRMDVAIRRWCIRSHDRAPIAGPPTPTIFLPDMHLPLVGKMPDLDPDLVPDPMQARCWCHGPIFSRLDGAAARASVYRAVGSRLTRNPNEWFYAMAASYNAAAEDLIRFVDRLGRHAASTPCHLVHLGGLFDVWAGYKCIFHSQGFAGLVEPRIVAGAGERELTSRWQDVILDGRPKTAVTRLFGLPADRRTLLSAPQGHFAGNTPPIGDAPRSLRTETFFAESRPEPLQCCVDQPPHARVGVLEGKAQFLPWTRMRTPGWRRELLTAAASRWVEQPFSAYVMAHTYEPCLAEVWVDPS